MNRFRPRAGKAQSTLLVAAMAAAVSVTAVVPPAAAGPVDDRAAPAGAGLLRVGERYAIASESAYASAAAQAVLEMPRATAVDAVVAAVLDIGVTLPEACGLGGGGFLVRRGPDGDVTTLDFREVAPSVPYGPNEQWKPYLSLAGARTHEGTGHAAVGVPGTLAGLHEMHRRWGKVPWKDLFENAIEDAELGFRAGPGLAASSLVRNRDMLAFQDTNSTFGGVVEGSLVKQPDLAETLKRLRDAKDPFDEFYGFGETARKIEQEMLRGVGERGTDAYGDYSKWAKGDLASYRVRVREPVVSRVGEHEVYGMGAPSSGGIVVAQILGMLSGDPIPQDLATNVPARARWVHLLAEVERLAFADRATWIGDPKATAVPTDAMLDPSYLAQRRALVQPETVLDLADHGGVYPAGQFDGYSQPPTADAPVGGTNTTHVSITTDSGEAVSLTCSIEQGLGSVVTAGGTGILLNSELTDFNPPGTNPGAANAYRPGFRPRSSMSPSVVVRDGFPILTVGGRGGPRIPSGVAQTILSVLRDGKGIGDALTGARVRGHLPDHVEGPRALDVEQVPLHQDRELKETLQKFGHTPVNFRPSFPFPVLSAVQGDRTTGSWTAASDPRGEAGSRAA